MSRVGLAIDIWVENMNGSSIPTTTTTTTYTPSMQFNDARNSMYIVLISSGV